MDPKKFIAVTEGPPGLCPGLWSYYEFFSTLNEDEEEDTNQGDWKAFPKRDEAVEHLYKKFIPALYFNGNPVPEYPLNKFSKAEKGIESDSFYHGRDDRSWMLDTGGLHIVYCCAMQQDSEFGVGIHWGNDIELALPIPPRSDPINNAASLQDLADLKAVEGALRDGMRFGKNRICVRSDSKTIVDRLNKEVVEMDVFGEGNHAAGRHYYNNNYKKTENYWDEIIKLINQLMCVNIQEVEKTDKNYHRARKLAHEGRNMVRSYSRTMPNKRNAK